MGKYGALSQVFWKKEMSLRKLSGELAGNWLFSYENYQKFGSLISSCQL
jgi:hypothetical protein